jgi:hypothetical protein
MRTFPLIALALLAACAPEGQDPTDMVEIPVGMITVIPVEHFMPSQVVLDRYPAHPGEEETFTADSLIIEGDAFAYEAAGLLYKVLPDLSGVYAVDYLKWCMLSEVRDGGDQPADAVPVAIASEIYSDYVRFDYRFGGEQTFILSCSFADTDDKVGFNASLITILNPSALPSGEVNLTSSGTNTNNGVERTVYLTP